MRRLALAVLTVLGLALVAAACAQSSQTVNRQQSSTGTQAVSSSSAATSGASSISYASPASSPSKASGQSSGKQGGDRASSGVAAKSKAMKSSAKRSSGTERGGLPGFTAASQAQGGTPGAADSIRNVRFGRHGSYERLVIDFGKNGGAATSVPRWRLSSPAGEGYSRIYLPGVRSTSASGSNLGGSIMDDYYVVRAPNGGLFVDVFATGGFRYRVFGLDNPGRLVIDYQPSGSALGRPLPVRGKQVVVMEPRKGESVSSPLTVEGYARTFEGQVTVLLKDSSGAVIARKSTKANDWSSTWGYFRTTLTFPAFNGSGTLEVGSASAKTGQFEGVSVPVSAGR